MPWNQGNVFPKIEEDIRYTVLDFPLTAADFRGLLPGCWFADQAIDCLVRIVTSPDDSFLKLPEISILAGSCVAIESTMMGSELQIGLAKKKNYVCNDLWIFPSHLHRNHWILFVVLVKEKVIVILDSLYDFHEYDTDEHLQVTFAHLSAIKSYQKRWQQQ